jgi:[ribosomal protein S18]-alanine N-acetyltransferase
MTADPPVELAVRDDAANIAEMSRDLIEHGLPWTWRVERVAKAIASPETNVAVIRGQGHLISFGIMEYWEEDAHLVLFAVRQAHQRRGIGSTLLRWLEQAAKVAGSQRIRVEALRANVAARSFYNEHGYHERVIARRMYSGAADGVRLEKWLRAVTPLMSDRADP